MLCEEQKGNYRVYYGKTANNKSAQQTPHDLKQIKDLRKYYFSTYQKS